MKRILSLILALLTLIPAAVFVSAEGYNDVDPTSWSADPIAYVTEKGFMNGTGDGAFSPKATMTRAMVVTVLWRMDGAEKKAGAIPFSDVPAGSWYADAVIWAAKNGVVNGTAPDKFSPSGKITREQLAAMMYRYASMKKLDVVPDGDLKTFSDEKDISAWASEPLSWAVGAGLIRGVTDDTVNPKGGATREQFAAILERFDKAEIPTFREVYLPVREAIADRTEEMLRE